MNKLFIIGNGFDLAHGLKTKYSDFLLWYIKKAIKEYNSSQSRYYEDELMEIENDGYKIKEFDSLKSLKELIDNKRISVKCKNSFFNKILKQTSDINWVDIEYEYYSTLLDIYKRNEKHNIGKHDGAEYHVKQLNSCFESIKDQLTQYLETIKTQVFDEQVNNRFVSEFKGIRYNEVLFLVFNYTDTLNEYVKALKLQYQIINIHGKLKDISNPIIFGYGDEMDEYYSKIESLNLNEFLRNMKSFNYFKTNNYQALNRFIIKGPYSVSIMGHSCGLSDRVLLNSIFCHQNCEEIRIYYYLKNARENDYFEKTQEISRHFTFNLKNKMRNIIVPYPQSFSLS